MSSNPPPADLKAAREEAADMWTYVRAAFNARARVRGLGDVPANWLYLLGVGVAGLVNPGFWLMGYGMELAYLVIASHDPRFRKWYHAVKAAASAPDPAARQTALLAGLSVERRDRYEGLKAHCGQLLRGRATPMTQQTIEAVNQLLWEFLKLLTSGQGLEAYLATTSRAQVAQEIETCERDLAAASQDPAREAIARSLEGTLEIARKRLANLDQARQRLEYIDAELLRIEQQVALVVEEAALGQEALRVGERVDAIVAGFSETSSWIREHADLLGSLESEADEPPPPIFEVQT